MGPHQRVPLGAWEEGGPGNIMLGAWSALSMGAGSFGDVSRIGAHGCRPLGTAADRWERTGARDGGFGGRGLSPGTDWRGGGANQAENGDCK